MFPTNQLRGKRVLLRPLSSSDFEQWSEVRQRSADWLMQWEPRPMVGVPDPAIDEKSFLSRIQMRDRERQLGHGAGFGIFIDDGKQFVGEINLNAIQRGPFQNAYIGYWVDQFHAGNGYVPEACVVALKYAFEDLALHRVQISIIPRNDRSRRVAEKLQLRDEGIAARYLEINGVWEDHIRFAMTAEEWLERREELKTIWLQ